MSDEQPHSAQWLNDLRDGWWNTDYLALVARRAQVERCRSVLDVGSGHGHWTRTVARLVADGAEVIGCEREPQWVEKARGGAPVTGRTLSYLQGTAEELPFPDARFDLVTCQTVLMHVLDPARVVREMWRVLTPGGRLLLCEPNLSGTLIARLSHDRSLDIDDLLAFARLHVTCERGRIALGLGDSSIGERLPSLLPADAVDVAAWNNDHPVVYRAPYSSHARGEADDERRSFDAGTLCWPHDDTARFFTAGGGHVEDFAALWTRARRAWGLHLDAIAAGRHAAIEGALHYLLTATKPG